MWRLETKCDFSTGAQARDSDHLLSVNGVTSGAAIKSSFERQEQFPVTAAPS
jgi:hypothetical protein